MEAEKYRNLGGDELALEARRTAEQLFRLRFQMKLGQTEGVKKLRELRRDIARIKTVERERELGLHPTPAGKLTDTEKSEASAAAAKPARKKAAKPARKKAAKKAASARKSGGRSAARRTAAKPSASKKRAARSTSVKKG
jgi:large subunit ribosomal protein L29